MSKQIKISDKFYEDAERIATLENQTVGELIEQYFRLAITAEKNPDLRVSQIRAIMKADVEEATEAYNFG